MEFTLGIIVSSVNREMMRKHIPYILRSTIILSLVIISLVAGVSLGDIYLDGHRDFMLMNWVALPCFVMIFLILGNARFDALAGNRFVSYMSALSYAFFLAQFFVWPLSYQALNRWIGIDNNIVRIIVSFTICAGISMLLHECAERPSSKFLRAKLLNKLV